MCWNNTKPWLQKFQEAIKTHSALKHKTGEIVMHNTGVLLLWNKDIFSIVQDTFDFWAMSIGLSTAVLNQPVISATLSNMGNCNWISFKTKHRNSEWRGKGVFCAPVKIFHLEWPVSSDMTEDKSTLERPHWVIGLTNFFIMEPACVDLEPRQWEPQWFA